MTSRLAWLFALSIFLFACGDDTGPRTSFISPAPVEVTAANRGLTIAATSSSLSLATRLTDDQAQASRLVVVDQIYSEYEHAKVGEVDRAPEPRFDVRMPATYETEDFRPSLDGAGSTYWVVDLQRLDREWLVDWNGLSRDEPEVREESLTFTVRRDQFDGDYQEDVIARVIAAFEDVTPKPQNVIIGTEMERHFAASPSDWPAFVAFSRELAAALRSVDPEVRVSVGINWSNFMTMIVPEFVGPVGGGVTYQTVASAWEAVIEPLFVRRSATGAVEGLAFDFYAFAAIPDISRFSVPSSIPDDHFAGVQTYLSENPSEARPVAWFAVGWPSTSESSSFFGEYWERFVETAGGTDVELVAWWGYGHLLGQSDCRTMTDVLDLDRTACFRGLYSSSGAPVPGLRDAYFGE